MSDHFDPIWVFVPSARFINVYEPVTFDHAKPRYGLHFLAKFLPEELQDQVRVKDGLTWASSLARPEVSVSSGDIDWLVQVIAQNAARNRRPDKVFDGHALQVQIEGRKLDLRTRGWNPDWFKLTLLAVEVTP